MKHFYYSDKKYYCGLKKTKENRCCGWLNFSECECISCLTKFLKILDLYKGKKKLYNRILEKAQNRLNVLIYEKDFEDLIK